MYRVISLSTTDKPYYSVICRYIEADSQKKRKLVLPIRELKPSTKDVLTHFQAIGAIMRSKHATLLNSVDEKVLLKCLLIAHYHSTGSTDYHSIELADKLMKSDGKPNNRRVSFKEPPEAIKYDADDNDYSSPDVQVNNNQVASTSTIADDYDEDDDDFAF